MHLPKVTVSNERNSAKDNVNLYVTIYSLRQRLVPIDMNIDIHVSARSQQTSWRPQHHAPKVDGSLNTHEYYGYIQSITGYIRDNNFMTDGIHE